MLEGAQLNDPREIKKNAIANHFKNFFKKGDRTNVVVKCSNLPKLSRVDMEQLEDSFSEEEVWKAIQSRDGDKALKPDGFNMKFFKEFWNLIKEDVMKVFVEFHGHGKLVRGLNATFITLIPKTSEPSTLSDYRPISLIGSVYKLIAKVLAVRLQGVLPTLISDNQFAFTSGRKIADCILIANEVVDAMNKKSRGWCNF